MIANTDAFINGLPCNNMLLFGGRGTGKSFLCQSFITTIL
ncbi:DUF815 domain-containing protein [endosymbiont 'TC1' of Trimyema compressum]